MSATPLPAAGGSYTLDPETGELKLESQTEPAPPPGTKAEPEPTPDAAPEAAPDATPRARKAVKET
jgi:hypothetical protein